MAWPTVLTASRIAAALTIFGPVGATSFSSTIVEEDLLGLDETWAYVNQPIKITNTAVATIEVGLAEVRTDLIGEFSPFNLLKKDISWTPSHFISFKKCEF